MNNIWKALKKLQEKKCTSLKKSRALIFCVKCINNILPIKDICYQRNPKLYKSQKCVACFSANESLYHIAECEIYQRIWNNLEEESIQLTRLEALTKLDILLEESTFRKAILGHDLRSMISNRKMYLRGFTNVNQQKEILSLTKSNKKASKVIVSYIEYFWSCFYERLWKFRCEVMADWEKANNISVREKKGKSRKCKRKRIESNKENIKPSDIEKESKGEKEKRIQTETSNRVNNWIKYSEKEKWLRFKNK